MKYYFSIRMTPKEFMPYYQGQIQTVITTTSDGLRIQFPAMHLRKFMTNYGIYGDFCLKTQNNKFLSLTKLP